MTYAKEYTTQELMAATVARQVRNDDVVFIGIGLPLIAGVVAVSTHALKAVLVYEGGGVGARTRRVPWSIADNATTDNAIAAVPMWRVLTELQRGLVTLGIVGGAEIDIFGNVNTTVIPGSGGTYKRPKVRLAGSGGANDIASAAGRTIIMMNLQAGKFVERVAHITSPGYISGPGAREKAGLTGGGPIMVCTQKCVFGFDDKTKEMYLKTLFPGVTVEDIKPLVGWDLKISPTLDVAELPTEEQVKLMKYFDPEGTILGAKVKSGAPQSFDDFVKTIRNAYEANPITW
jgi:glutaconate CoA-transferase, subunit B